MASRPKDTGPKDAGPKDAGLAGRERDGLVDRLATGVALLAVVALIALTPLA